MIIMGQWTRVENNNEVLPRVIPPHYYYIYIYRFTHFPNYSVNPNPQPANLPCGRKLEKTQHFQ